MCLNMQVIDLLPVAVEMTEMEGPFECPVCHGHMFLDSTFLEQVTWAVTCPYCEASVQVNDGNI